MPNRILRDWTDSTKFDGLSADAERLFVRLLMKADDYGRFHANPKLIKAACFPLAEDLRANTVAAWLTELSDRHLVFSYTSGTGSYLAIVNFRQRLKQSVPKFPPPEGKPREWMPDGGNPPPDSGRPVELPGTSRNIRPESESESETESDARVDAPAGSENLLGVPAREPTLEEVRGVAREKGYRCDPDRWYQVTKAAGWVDSRGRPIRDWRAALAAWERLEARMPARNGTGQKQAVKPPPSPEEEARRRAVQEASRQQLDEDLRLQRAEIEARRTQHASGCDAA